MRRIHRVALLALLIGVAPVIAGCADFDPENSLDFLGINQKKKLPGERKALFPEGVPGVSQGIPQEYMKGNLTDQTGAAIPMQAANPATATPAGAESAQTKTATAEPAESKPKPKPRKHVVHAKPKPKAEAKSEEQPKAQPAAAQQQASPWPAQSQPQQSQQSASPWPSQTQQSPAPWPSAPPPGTFSKQ
jgi:hypothetical protein